MSSSSSGCATSPRVAGSSSTRAGSVRDAAFTSPPNSPLSSRTGPSRRASSPRRSTCWSVSTERRTSRFACTVPTNSRSGSWASWAGSNRSPGRPAPTWVTASFATRRRPTAARSLSTSRAARSSARPRLTSPTRTRPPGPSPRAARRSRRRGGRRSGRMACARSPWCTRRAGCSTR